MAQTGDYVRYLNATGGGRIVRIDGPMAYVDEDGFETPVLLRECVVVAHAGEEPARTAFRAVPTPAPKKEPEPKPAPAAPAPQPEPEPVEETPEGDTMNVVLAFEPHDIKKLTESPLDIVLVNDSNYYLSYTLAHCATGLDEWTLIAAGTVEPNMQIVAKTLQRNEIQPLDNIALQYLAYKAHKPYAAKAPALVVKRLDTTKLCKYHCFTENTYFDTPVIALDIVKDDHPCVAPPRQPLPDAAELERAMREKRRDDRRPVQKRKAPERKQGEIIEVDLHIAELIDNTRGLSNADMLNLQVDEFRRVMDANLKNKGQRIVFIHGKGEGVLRQALMKELTHRYKGHDVQDASFREYGFGATQVTIR